MDGGSSAPVLAGKILLLVVLILLNAFFAAAEIAVISVNEGKIKKNAEDGDKKSRKLIKLLDNMSGFLATIQVGVTLSGLLASASAAQSFVEPIVGLFNVEGATKDWVEAATLVVITLVLAFFTLVFGELVPKRVAMQRAEKMALNISGIILFFSKLMAPFVWLLTKTTNGILRLCGIDPNKNDEEVTEEEIRIMVEEGEEAGVVEEAEKQMIDNVFELNDLLISEIMTHRTEIAAISSDDGIDEAIEIATKEGYSRIPVYEETIDDIIGILYVKDLLKFVTKNAPKNFDIKKILRPVYFVPDTNTASEVLSELQKRHQHIAIVLDEYGGTAGLVTMENLIESIVGNIQDEYDDEEEEIKKVNDYVFEIDGSSDLEDVSETLGFDLPEGEYSTVGGMIVDKLNRVLEDGETPTVEFDGFKCEVLKTEDHRIISVRITKYPKQIEEDE